MTNQSGTQPYEIAAIFSNEEEKLVAYGIKTISRAIAVVFICLFGSIASCSMVNDLTSSLQGSYEKARLEGEASLEKARAVSVEAQIKLEQSQVESIKSLIDSGIPPIEARCAVLGWDYVTDEDICKQYVLFSIKVDTVEDSVSIKE